MAAPTFQLSESNGSGPTVTDNTTSIVYASADSNSNTSNLATNSPITAGNNSYEKWNRLKVTGAADNSLSAFGVWWNSTAPKDSGNNNITNFYFATNHAYATPVATTSTIATTQTSTVTSSPGTSLTAPSNSVSSYSAYFISQLDPGGGAVGGNVSFASPAVSVGYTYS